MTKTFYAITTPFDMYVTTDLYAEAGPHTYAGLGALPTLFATRNGARAVIADYKRICKNSGKPATPMTIVTVQI